MGLRSAALACALTWAVGVLWAAPAPGAGPVRTPVSAQVSTLVTDSAGLVAHFDALDTLGGRWYAAEDNRSGAIAWQESFVLMSYLEMYSATEDARYLDLFVAHGRAVLAARDEARGVTDYAGRSGPVWRSGGRYNWAMLTLAGADGKDFGLVVAMRPGLNDQTVLTITADPSRGTFDLVARNAALKRTESFRALSVSSGSSRYWPDLIARHSALIRGYKPRPPADLTLPAPVVDATLAPCFVVHVAHTGLVALPLARFARLVRADPAMSARYGTDAARFLGAAQDAAAFHDGQWEQDGAGTGYRNETDAPTFLRGSPLPLNQDVVMGRAMLELARATGRETYRRRAELIGEELRRAMVENRDHGYVWRYRRDGSGSWEDVSHAALAVDFAFDAAQGPDPLPGYDDSMLARIANTLVVTMRRGRVFSDRVGGPWRATDRSANKLAAARWMKLGRVSGDITDALMPVIWELPEAPATGQNLYAAALAASSRAARAIEPDRAAAAPAARVLVPRGRLAKPWGRITLATWRRPARVEVYVDGRRASGLRRVAPLTWRFWTKRLRPGRHRLDVVLSDALGRSRRVTRHASVDGARRRAAKR